MEKSELAVGDSTALEIIFSTRTYNQKVTKRPRITTNEGPPDKTVSISADVIQRPDSTYPIIIKPYKLDISQFGDKVRDKMKFTITNAADEELALKLVADLPQFAEITLPKKIGPGETASGEIKLKPQVLERSFEKSFTIEVEKDKGIRFTVPVKRSVKEPNAAKTGETSQPASSSH
ncbi:MAG: hypothetical protein AB1772_05030 [Candidatus Zixiibacteriota bacterium]